RVFAEAGYTFEGTDFDNKDTDDATNFGVGARFYW
ncbi:porin, partial [Vibrio parahaemolyticus]|nr:porin [Vibrio parahaemolyticus]